MNPKIIVQLKGGLGNQMFQYALGRALALRSNGELYLDTGWYQTTNFRVFTLANFNIVVKIASEADLRPFERFRQDNFYGKIFREIEKVKPFAWRQAHKEANANVFDTRFTKMNHDIYLIGNWQTEKYFSDFRDVILNDFTLNSKLNFSQSARSIIDKMKNSVSVSLHVRRGDYLTNPKARQMLGICPIEYYQQAEKIIISSVSNSVLFVFSDDVGWVRKNLKFSVPTVYVSGGLLKDYEEITLMSYCQHNIIANSSFSWWGAWLNNNQNKIVVAPSNWYVDKKFSTNDLIPDSWLKI